MSDDDPLRAVHENVLDLKAQVEALQHLVLVLIFRHGDVDLVRYLVSELDVVPPPGAFEPFEETADRISGALDELRRKVENLLSWLQ